MKDLLKEAIADAKAVRETALANAKLALEEAFTPRLQSMLSAKLAEEMDEEPVPTDDEETYEGPVPTDDETYEEPVPTDDEETYEGPVPTEPTNELYNELNLEDIIRELEGDDTDPVDEDTQYDNETPPKKELTGEDIDINEIIRALREEEEEEMPTKKKVQPTDEDIDIREIIRGLYEEEGAVPPVDDTDDTEDMKTEELEEAYNVIRFLKDKINEVNLLNAKLLYSNKLFRNFSLNEGQKMKVIENFDRAHNLREVKLVYSTLAEGFQMPSTKKVVKESFASRPVASTKPARPVLSEGADLAARFKKLAGLK